MPLADWSIHDCCRVLALIKIQLVRIVSQDFNPLVVEGVRVHKYPAAIVVHRKRLLRHIALIDTLKHPFPYRNPLRSRTRLTLIPEPLERQPPAHTREEPQ